MGWFSNLFNPLKEIWNKVNDFFDQTGQTIGKFFYDKEGKSGKVSNTYSRNYRVAGITYNDTFTFSFTFHQPTILIVINYAGAGTSELTLGKKESLVNEYFDFLFSAIKEADTKYKLGLSYDELNSSVQAGAQKIIDNQKRLQSSGFFLTALISIISLNLVNYGLIAYGLFAGAFFGESVSKRQNEKIANEASKNLRFNDQLFFAKMRQSEQLKKGSSELLSKYMVFGEYSIYANGAVFKRGAAGSQSFCASSAFDTSKGIYAHTNDTTIDDMIALRYGGIRAGGKFFISTLLDTDFALDSFELNQALISQMYKRRYNDFLSRINAGFNALFVQTQIDSSGNKMDFDTYFNADGKAEQKYKRVIDTQTAYIKKQIINNDFLDKLKNYSKDLMADFDYLKMSDFDKRSKNTTPDTNIPSYDEEFQEMMDDESINVYIRAFAYINELVEKFYTLKDLSATQHIKITKDEQRLEAVLDEQNALVLAGDLSQSDILNGFFKGGKEFTGDDILSLFKNDFVVKFQKEDLYKGGNVLAFYEFMVSDESCVYMKKDEYDRFIKAPYLPETMKDYDFSQIIIEQNV